MSNVKRRGNCCRRGNFSKCFKALMSNVKQNNTLPEETTQQDTTCFKALMSNVKQYKYKLFISLKKKKINIKGKKC